MLQLYDISKDIMINVANGEKKLLATINATVSHEMRNPLNSIYCQNIKQLQISEKMQDFLAKDFNQLSLKKIKNKMKKYQKEYRESIKIQMSSSKILNFLVNDILDFAQMRSGKFRKDISNFNIKEAVQEIV